MGGAFAKLEKRNVDRNYQLVREIGSGQYGKVYEAVNRQTGETVALKILKLIDRQEARATIREFNIMRHVSARPNCHPGIVCYYAIFLGRHEGEQRLCVEMEYVEGEDLEKWWRRHVIQGKNLLTDAELLSMMTQVYGALTYLNAKNVAHRDIKPANIMRKPDGTLVLVDFGLSCFVRQAPGKGLLCPPQVSGSPAYVAPELYADVNHADLDNYQPADIWATGVMFYRLANVQYPFPAKNVDVMKAALAACLQRAEDGDVDSIAKFTAASRPRNRKLREVLSESLICDPTDRITAPEAMVTLGQVNLG